MMKIFQKEKKWRKEKESRWLKMDIYWKFAVVFMFAATILSFFLGYYLFARINKESSSSPSIDSSQFEAAKKQRVDKVLEYFSAREKKSNEILNFPAPIIDPSL